MHVCKPQKCTGHGYILTVVINVALTTFRQNGGELSEDCLRTRHAVIPTTGIAISWWETLRAETL